MSFPRVCEQYSFTIVADHAWLRQIRKIMFLGTPHHGSPLERRQLGECMLRVNPHTATFARLGRMRSAGSSESALGQPAGSGLGEARQLCAQQRPAPIGATAGRRAVLLHWSDN